MDQQDTIIRCAIYTRKSTEDGLEQEFNTLDAQRESAINLIAAHRGEGWVEVKDEYNDGAFSGKNIERPALQRLLADIDQGKIDKIICYKIDRFSRSLTDFTQMLDLFEKKNISFESVTQQFSTATAMGKLTLNILMSFSEFEREISRERTLDKIAASKRKGIWMGGTPPLGYDVGKRRLVINETEAELIKHIFKRFTQINSVTQLSQELNEENYHTKKWTTAGGTPRGGKPFNKGHLYKLLHNPVYIGIVAHKGNQYSGEHQAIIDDSLFNEVQTIMKKSLTKRSKLAKAKSPALLKGLVFTKEGNAMTPSHSKKGSKTYHYYTSTQAIKQGYSESNIRQVPQGEIEEIVLNQIHSLFRAPELVMATWKVCEEEKYNLKEKDVIDCLKNIDPVWEHLFPLEKARIIQLLVSKVIVSPVGVDLHLKLDGIQSLITDLQDKAIASYPDQGHQCFIIHIPIQFKRKDGRKLIIIPDGVQPFNVIPQEEKTQGGLLRTLLKAHHWQQQLDSGKVDSISKIAEQEGVSKPYIAMTMRLTLLAPDIHRSHFI
jgi:site-specific DNA recombinase